MKAPNLRLGAPQFTGPAAPQKQHGPVTRAMYSAIEWNEAGQKVKRATI